MLEQLAFTVLVLILASIVGVLAFRYERFIWASYRDELTARLDDQGRAIAEINERETEMQKYVRELMLRSPREQQVPTPVTNPFAKMEDRYSKELKRTVEVNGKPVTGA